VDIVTRVLRALSEAELGDTWPAEFYEDELKHIISDRGRKILKLAARMVNYAPIPRYLRTFSMMSRDKRWNWISGLNSEGMIYDLINVLEFLMFASYFVKPENYRKIGYDRAPLKPPRGEKVVCSISTSDYSMLRDRYDVIVVGSGAGGAVLAWRLVENGFSVALFEAGSSPREEDLLNMHPVIRALRYYWENGLTFTWGTPVISLPIGRVLGGTVTVNSGTLFRAPKEACSEWRDEVGISIPMDRLEDAYKVVEGKLGVRPVPEDLIGSNGEVMRRGAMELGLSHGSTPRPLGNCLGMGECAFGCPFGGKIDMRLSFLREAMDKGLHLFTKSYVDKILFRGRRAVGVSVDINGVRRRVSAHAVVLAAGALSTPKLLRASGVKNRHLGRHLHIHPAAGVTGIMDYEVLGWRGTMQSYYVDELLDEYRTLLLATFPPPGVGYSAGSIPPNEVMRYRYLASIGVQMSDTGEGEVKEKFNSIASYSIDPEDLEKIKVGIRLSSEILFAAGAVKVYPPLKKNMGVSSMGELNRLLDEAGPRRFKLSAYHPQATARMGGDGEIGVVDVGGEVYGYENLFVADASVIPTSTIVNPQLTINALALLIADNVMDVLGG